MKNVELADKGVSRSTVYTINCNELINIQTGIIEPFSAQRAKLTISIAKHNILKTVAKAKIRSSVE